MGGHTSVRVDEAIQLSWLTEATGFLLRGFRSRWIPKSSAEKILIRIAAEGQQDWSMAFW